MLNSEQERYIEDMYIEMYYPLSAYAQSALNDKQLAEEAVQETFRIACAKADSLKSSQNPKGWLMNTLKYVIQNMRRSRARLNRFILYLISSYNKDEDQIYADDMLDIHYQNIISKEEYDLLKKAAIDGYSTKELAMELGISVDACRKRIRRAKTKLKEAIKNDI